MPTTLPTDQLLQAATRTPDPEKTAKTRKALKKSCQDFEALFLQSVVKSMRKTVPESGLFAKSNAVETFQDMLDQEIVSTTAHRQSLGLAEQMYRQMEKHLPADLTNPANAAHSSNSTDAVKATTLPNSVVKTHR